MNEFINTTKIIGTAITGLIGYMLGTEFPMYIFSGLGFLFVSDILTAILREIFIAIREKKSPLFYIRSKVGLVGFGVKLALYLMVLNLAVAVKILGFNPYFISVTSAGIMAFFEVYSNFSNVQSMITGKRLPEAELFNLITPIIKRSQKLIITIIEKIFSTIEKGVDDK